MSTFAAATLVRTSRGGSLGRLEHRVHLDLNGRGVFVHVDAEEQQPARDGTDAPRVRHRLPGWASSTARAHRSAQRRAGSTRQTGDRDAARSSAARPSRTVASRRRVGSPSTAWMAGSALATEIVVDAPPAGDRQVAQPGPGTRQGGVRLAARPDRRGRWRGPAQRGVQ